MWYCRITEINEIEPQPVVRMPTPSTRRTKVQFGQNPFADIKFGPAPPPRISITRADIGSSKRKLDDSELEDASDPSLFKRVRLISKRDRVRRVAGPFSQSSSGLGHSAMDAKAKQKAEERKAQEKFNSLSAHLGLDHPETLASLNNLAFCLRNQRKFTLAEGLFRSAYEVHKNVMIIDDPDALQRIISNIMLVLVDQNKRMELQEVWQRTKSLYEANLEPQKAEELSLRLKLMHMPNAQEASVLVSSSSQNQESAFSFDSLADTSFGHWIQANSKGAIRWHFDGVARQSQSQDGQDGQDEQDSQDEQDEQDSQDEKDEQDEQDDTYPSEFSCYHCKVHPVLKTYHCKVRPVFKTYQEVKKHLKETHGFQY